MTHIAPPKPDKFERATPADAPVRARRWPWAVLALLALGGGALAITLRSGGAPPAHPSFPTPHVTVATSRQATVTPETTFLGQFSAVDSVELRAQVGGTLTSIGFRDGQIVHKGDLLFTIDPRPYQIRLAQANAQLDTAQARDALSGVELWRARQLKRSDYGTAESVDQRSADARSAAAAIAAAKAAVADAALDLEFSRITAPFTGKIGAHQVSVGSLVSGSRGGTSPTTLLATLVSLDPIYLDFDMSESDYAAFRRAHPVGSPTEPVAIALDGETGFPHRATLDFLDNAIDRASGTIHARATVPNPDLSLTPGEFARVRVATGAPFPALLVPPAAIVPDQSRQLVLTVGPDGTVIGKPVETGPLDHGLRVIRSGLAPTDRVIIDGLMLARPGAKVIAAPGRIGPEG